jgi:predicted permease
MNWIKQLFSRRRLYDDLSEEIQDHLREKIDELVARGMPESEAAAAARREFGNVTLVKERSREVWRWPSMENFLMDVHYGLRLLRKNPGFTAMAVLTLAIGIGANTAIFSVLESQLWHPLPFPDSERLVDVHTVLRDNPKQWDVLSSRMFQAWRSQTRSLAGLVGYSYPTNRNLTADGSAERVLVMPVTSNFFEVLQVPLARGRAFLAEEETPGRDRAVIVSYSFWQNRFASDPGLLGKQVLLDGQPYIVAGITSPRLHFEFIEEPAVFVPLAMDSSQVTRNLYAIGRLAPNETPQQVREELAVIFDRVLKSEGLPLESTAAVANLRETWTQFAAQPLYFFAGAITLVLLIACVNTAGLLLARGLARQREFAVRATLGAGRATLVRQSLIESLLMSLAGGAVGTIFGIWGAGVLAKLLGPERLPRTAPIALDFSVLAFVLGVSIVSALLLGIAPALFASHVDLNHALRHAARGLSANRSQLRSRSSLVAVEVALALVLLFGAGLFLSSFVRLQEAPRGFDAPGALTFRVDLHGENYAKPDQMQRYFNILAEQLRSIPGVREVTLGSGLPVTGSTGLFATVNVAGRPPADKYGTFLIMHTIAPNYFQALHMHLLAGRPLDPHDAEGAARVAVVNRNAAQDLFGHEDPLGKILEFVAQPQRGVPAQAPVQIVGVVENAQEFGANETPFKDLYVPFSQHPVPSSYVLIDSNLPRGSLLASIRAAASSLDKDQPVFDVQTMDDRITSSVQGARFTMLIVAALAAVALVLVFVGIFGTVAYFVQQRTQEFGIRLALGASPARILRDAIAQSLVIGVAGLAIGVSSSLILGRLLRHALYLVPHEHTGMLYGVRIHDPLIMFGACGLLIAVLLFASYIPARRAMRVDPMVALRYE